MTKSIPTWISEDDAKRQGVDDASRKVKDLAKEQRISVTITNAQMEAILKQWSAVDNRKPAEISFVVEGSARARLRVAAYGYFKDTCCA